MSRYYSWDYRVLKTFAKHYSTGEIIPEKLVASMQGARKMFAATDLQRQVIVQNPLINQWILPLHVWKRRWKLTNKEYWSLFVCCFLFIRFFMPPWTKHSLGNSQSQRQALLLRIWKESILVGSTSRAQTGRPGSITSWIMVQVCWDFANF